MELPPFHPRRPGLVSPVRLDPAGTTGPTRDQAKGPRWQRVSRGLYLPSEIAISVEQRVVNAGARLPEFGGVTGWAALRWLGGTYFDGLGAPGRAELPVVLVTGPDDIRPQPGIVVSAERLNPRDLIVHDDLRLTHGPRSVAFELRYAADVRDAVVVADMAAYDDLVSLAEAASYVAGLQGWTGVPLARAALLLADENSWSPQETRLRLVWELDAGLQRPLTNVPLFDLAGHHLGTPDLFDPVAGVVAEYDGALHLAGRQRRKDVAREQRFRNHGLEYLSVVAGDLWHTDLVVDRVLGARSRARWTPPSRRDWTLERPPWWQSLASVDARRAHRERGARPRRG